MLSDTDQQDFVLTAEGLQRVIMHRFYRLPFPIFGRLMQTLHTQDVQSYWKYLEALELVERWENGDKPARPFEGENVLEHVAFGMHVLWIMKQGFRSLCKVVDINQVADYYFFHDGGEIAVGDISNTDPRLTTSDATAKEQTKKIKAEQEMQGFIQKVIALFPKHLQPQVLQCFLEYESRETLPTWFAKWIDIVAGNRIALEYFYPERNELSAERMKGIALAKFFSQTEAIRQELLQKVSQREDRFGVFQEALEEFLVFANMHLEEIISFGYLPEVESYQQAYPELVNLVRR